jgi:hypothetical protein
MNSKDDWLEISNIHKFTNYIRTMVFVNFIEDKQEIDIIKCFEELSEKEKQELDDVLSKKECLIIVKAKAKRLRHKSTKKIKYLINDTTLAQIVDEINQRLVSNIIQTLVSKGLLETAFDAEVNDFVFWVKDQEK